MIDAVLPKTPVWVWFGYQAHEAAAPKDPPATVSVTGLPLQRGRVALETVMPVGAVEEPPAAEQLRHCVPLHTVD
jgi:hypothetical protein